MAAQASSVWGSVSVAVAGVPEGRVANVLRSLELSVRKLAVEALLTQQLLREQHLRRQQLHFELLF